MGVSLALVSIASPAERATAGCEHGREKLELAFLDHAQAQRLPVDKKQINPIRGYGACFEYGIAELSDGDIWVVSMVKSRMCRVRITDSARKAASGPTALLPTTTGVWSFIDSHTSQRHCTIYMSTDGSDAVLWTKPSAENNRTAWLKAGSVRSIENTMVTDIGEETFALFTSRHLFHTTTRSVTYAGPRGLIKHTDNGEEFVATDWERIDGLKLCRTNAARERLKRLHSMLDTIVLPDRDGELDHRLRVALVRTNVYPANAAGFIFMCS